MVEKILEGTFDWIKCHPDFPEEFTGPDGVTKKSWSAIIYPTKDSLEEIRIMQAQGIKNKLKMDGEKGWNAKFSIPTDKKNKKGVVTETFTAPKVVDGEGKVISERIANGAKGFMKLNYTEGKTALGSYRTARLAGLKLTEWRPYGSEPKVNTEVKQENFY